MPDYGSWQPDTGSSFDRVPGFLPRLAEAAGATPAQVDELHAGNYIPMQEALANQWRRPKPNYGVRADAIADLARVAGPEAERFRQANPDADIHDWMLYQDFKQAKTDDPTLKWGDFLKTRNAP